MTDQEIIDKIKYYQNGLIDGRKSYINYFGRIKFDDGTQIDHYVIKNGINPLTTPLDQEFMDVAKVEIDKSILEQYRQLKRSIDD